MNAAKRQWPCVLTDKQKHRDAQTLATRAGMPTGMLRHPVKHAVKATDSPPFGNRAPSVTPIKKNILANIAGNGWTAIISVIFAPLYIHFMGIEAFGLIGLFLAMYPIFALMDAGISATLNREMAKLSVQTNKNAETRNVVRTLEVVIWVIALIAGIVVATLAPVITHHWLPASQLPRDSIQHAITIMAATVSMQLLVGFYSAGLQGTQRQVLLNGINVGMQTVRHGGAVIVLWLVSPAPEAFFIWQGASAALHALLLARVFWHYLPEPGAHAGFPWQPQKELWRFAAGISGITILGVILSQLDKIILSKLVSLEQFGYYSLASLVAMGLGRLVNPVYSALYPRFTQLVTLREQETLRKLYHQSCQLIAVLILPAAIVIAFFSEEILTLWTQSQVAAAQSHGVLSILVVGSALNGLMHLPYALQLAHGNTRLAFYSNLVAIMVVTPLIYFMAKHFGTLGAATGWVVLNTGYLLISVQIMHKNMLPDEKQKWYWEDITLPLVAALLTVGIARLALTSPLSPAHTIELLFGISMAAYLSTAMAATQLRPLIIGRFMKYLKIPG